MSIASAAFGVSSGALAKCAFDPVCLVACCSSSILRCAMLKCNFIFTHVFSAAGLLSHLQQSSFKRPGAKIQ
eukprot:2595454-Ditylum_brightwellii.AAC.2